MAKERILPNGGIPIQMSLYPKAGEVVLHSVGGELSVISRAAWDKDKAHAAPLFTLNEDECAALAWQLGYWLGKERLRPGYQMGERVQADYG
jgi:hypothetical protein